MSAAPTHEEVRWLRPKALAGVEILSASRNTALWLYHHESYDLCAIDSGGCNWDYRSSSHATGERGVMLLEPGGDAQNNKSP